jgi:hypothetical protein
MGTDTLTETDLQLLQQLSDAPERRSTLEARFADCPEPVDDRLAVLVDSGLIRQADVTYELTESGRRALAAPGDGTADSRIDVPPDVETELQDLDVDGACMKGVRAAYAFLEYWGEATESEFRDAVYAERQAGYDNRQAWWDNCIEPVLETLPTLTPPMSTGLTAKWRYDGTPGIDGGMADGRAVLGSTDGQPFANARQAIEAETRSATQRTVARHVFAHLETRGHADRERLELLIVEATEKEAQSGSIAVVVDVLASVPSVVNEDGVWRYRHTAQQR